MAAELLFGLAARRAYFEREDLSLALELKPLEDEIVPPSHSSRSTCGTIVANRREAHNLHCVECPGCKDRNNLAGYALCWLAGYALYWAGRTRRDPGQAAIIERILLASSSPT